MVASACTGLMQAQFQMHLHGNLFGAVPKWWFCPSTRLYVTCQSVSINKMH